MGDKPPTFEEFLQKLRDSGTPGDVALAHDLELIENKMQTWLTNPRTSPWHNAAIGMITETEAEGIVDKMLELGHIHPFAAEGMGPVLAAIFERFFYAGYELGESSEHIRKCTCPPDNVVHIDVNMN